ncbi:hypothetical protein MBLNU457_4595t1 [Dothideomycetes sp. NU457]
MPGSFETDDSTNTVEEEDDNGESTPKADATAAVDTVPIFNLDESHIAEPIPTTSPPTRSEPKAPSSLHTSMKPPPPPSIKADPRPSTLMPPPSMKAPTRPLTQSTAPSLRVPTTGPLPNRGPPASAASQARSSLSPTAVANTAGVRNKVQLTPGHSPLDWASLQRSKNLSGVPNLQRVTPSQLKNMNGRKGKPAWSSYGGKVYHISPYLPFHPGGEGQLMRAAGKDGEKLFMEAHPWVNWENMMTSCLVGVMISETEAVDDGLEGMD